MFESSRVLIVLCGLAGLVALVAPSALHAQSDASAPTFVEGTRAMSLGGAFTGVATGADGLYHNPGGIATARMYVLDGMFELNPDNTILNATIVDSQNNPKLAGAVGYSYLIARDSDVSGHDIRLALAVPAVQDTISVGLGGRYLILSDDEGIEFARGFTLDSGIVAQPAGELRLGLAAKNLIDICRKPNVCGGVTPRLIDLGVAYGDPTQFTVAADVGTNLSQGDDPLTMRVDVGGEYMIQGKVPVRAGYQWRQLIDRHSVTFGGGWRSKGFGLDVGVGIPPETPGDFRVSAGVELYVR